MELSFCIGDVQCEGVQDTIVTGVTLEGASWTKGSLALSSELRCLLPPSKLRWGLRSASSATSGRLLFPLYLNELRSTVVAEVHVAPPKNIPAEVWSQRGVGFIMQTIM